MVIEEVSGGPGEEELSSASAASAAPPPLGGHHSPRRQEQRGGADKAAPRPAAPPSDPSLQSAAANQEASPAERPVERKSYALARRTRSRPADLGSKQASVEESASGGSTSSPSGGGGKGWVGGADGSGPPAAGRGGAGLAELDQDVARLSLAQQNWTQSPTSYMRSEMRGESSGSDPLRTGPLRLYRTLFRNLVVQKPGR